MDEKLFLMIKPWALNFYEEILANFRDAGKLESFCFIPQLPQEAIIKTYSEHKGKIYFEPFMKDHLSQSGIIAVYSGNLDHFLEIKKDIRKKFLNVVQQPSFYVRNPIHTSVNSEEYKRCMEIWGSYFYPNLDS